jgi:prepilin-type N-terminal cleavage/methylation domain-containing protein
MKYNHYQLSANRNPLTKAFTLVELLVVIVVISILASLSMYALNGTYNAAKESKTRGTISKLNAAIMDIYEGYQDKFDNISLNDSKIDAACIFGPTGTYMSFPETQKKLVRAKVKMHFIHDTMRMEMPNRWDEVIHNADTNNLNSFLTDETRGFIPLNNGGTPYHYLNANPPVLKFYRDAYKEIFGTFTYPPVPAAGTIHAPASSELLFLIISNLNPEALENFHGSEIGDIDGNGFMEFHDAWGNPIGFIRCAPAFPASDIQPNVVSSPNRVSLDPSLPPLTWTNPMTIADADWSTDWTTYNITTSPSPADTAKILANIAQTRGMYDDPFDGGDINRTRLTFPLIVSGGADGSIDLMYNTTPETQLPVAVTNLDNDILHSARYPWGLPGDTDGNGVLNHHDNITNHRNSNSF